MLGKWFIFCLIVLKGYSACAQMPQEVMLMCMKSMGYNTQSQLQSFRLQYRENKQDTAGILTIVGIAGKGLVIEWTKNKMQKKMKVFRYPKNEMLEQKTDELFLPWMYTTLSKKASNVKAHSTPLVEPYLQYIPDGVDEIQGVHCHRLKIVDRRSSMPVNHMFYIGHDDYLIYGERFFDGTNDGVENEFYLGYRDHKKVNNIMIPSVMETPYGDLHYDRIELNPKTTNYEKLFISM